MKEHLKGNDHIEIEGQEHLDAVKKLNAQGIHCVFAPNHVAPESALRRNMALANDYPQLKSVLDAQGISSTVLFRGDGDMAAKSGIGKAVYGVHSRIMSAIGRRASGGGIPVKINAKNPVLASSQNVGNIREVFRKLEEGNMTIYPYGNWFASGEQTFDETQDLAGDSFVDKKEFEHWRTSLKDGAFRIAQRTKSPVVPVYVETKDGAWKIRFGAPILSDVEGDALPMAKEYLAKMRELKGAKN